MAKRRIKHHPIVGTVAERLRKARRQAVMTQQELASKSNVSVSYVARLERGEAAVGVDVMADLAAALRISPGDLVSFRPDPVEKLSVIQSTLIEKAKKLSKRNNVDALRSAALMLHLIDNALSHKA